MSSEVTIPGAIWILVRRGGGKVIVADDAVKAIALGGARTIRYGEVTRLGLGKIRIVAAGLGGYLAKQRMGGNEATHIVAKLANGTQQSFVVSQYEDWEEIVRLVSAKVGKPYEEMSSGVWGLKWPKLPGEA